MNRVVAFVATIAFLALPLLASATRNVRTITITSKWGGLSFKPVPSEQYVISFANGRYSANGKVIDVQLVQNLMDALNAPVLPAAQLDNMGLTQSWLGAHAEEALTSLHVASALPEQRALFLRTFSDVRQAQQLLPLVSKPYTHTDDYPSIRVDIVALDGRATSVDAFSQAPLMVPWQIKYEGHTNKTWNADIGRSIGALLPAKFLNGYLLQGETLEPRLAEVVMDKIRIQWDILGAESETHGLIAELGTRYRLEEAKVQTAYDDDFESSEQYEAENSSNFFSTLSRPQDPSNFKLYFVALHAGHGASSPSPITVDSYAQTVLGVPWMAKFIHQHPEWPIGIRIVDGRSLSPIGVARFARDMQQAGHPELIDRVRREAKDIALLMTDRGRWLVFPDHSAILWRALDFDQPGWLGLKPESLPEHECGDGYSNCPSVRVSSSGRVQ